MGDCAVQTVVVAFVVRANLGRFAKIMYARR